MAVIRTEPLGWASSGVRLLSDENEVAELSISTLKGKGSFEVDGDAFTIDSHGLFRSNAVLKRGSSVIARVKHIGFFGRRFEISSAGHKMMLEGQGFRGRSYVLRLMDREVGSIKREGFMGRRMSLEFPDEVPTFLQVLIAYVVLTQSRRESAAAAAGS